MTGRAEPAPGAPPPMDPAVALGPSPHDPHRLLVLALVRRASIGLFAIGLLVGVVTAGVRHEEAEVFVDTSSTDSVLGGVLTSFGLVFVAILVRLATRWLAVGLAYPVARLHQGDLGGRRARARWIAVHLDRLAVAQAFRELRWTRGVLEAARSRTGAHAARYARLDRGVGVGNVVAGIACVVSVLVFGATIEM